MLRESNRRVCQFALFLRATDRLQLEARSTRYRSLETDSQRAQVITVSWGLLMGMQQVV